MKKIQELLNINKPIRDADWCNAEIDLICKKLQSLITTKPCVYLINISASGNSLLVTYLCIGLSYRLH